MTEIYKFIHRPNVLNVENHKKMVLNCLITTI